MGSAVSREEFERLQQQVEILEESIGILSNKEMLQQIEDARRRRNEDDVISFDDVKDQFSE
jgi:PHD/YefM family antitoxin component YafN of YafNO toxin-antitoxin module